MIEQPRAALTSTMFPRVTHQSSTATIYSTGWSPGEVAQVAIGAGSLFLAILALVIKYHRQMQGLIMRWNRLDRSSHRLADEESFETGAEESQYEGYQLGNFTTTHWEQEYSNWSASLLQNMSGIYSTPHSEVLRHFRLSTATIKPVGWLRRWLNL
ncbi:hypothetical protein K440DRAFT_230490 [Wilcoxina mikolae CBS 423.85]|nr:hypothetical protein K440DRAFT_230490 [Wilcoxina mikolae CBS 423.85]